VAIELNLDFWGSGPLYGKSYDEKTSSSTPKTKLGEAKESLKEFARNHYEQQTTFAGKLVVNQSDSFQLSGCGLRDHSCTFFSSF